jgi:hypothetical protein
MHCFFHRVYERVVREVCTYGWLNVRFVVVQSVFVLDEFHRATVLSVNYDSMAASIDVSMVTLHTFRTSDSERIFAMDSVLYHTTPRFLKSAMYVDVCLPSLVRAHAA